MIWTPPSHRFSSVLEARQAAQDYDPNLDFGFNESTQQWCVYIKKGTMPAAKENDFPILGFREVPTRGQVQKRLYESDAFRKGQEILDKANRHNDQLLNKDYSNVDGNVAEYFEWGMRKMGSDRAPIKVFMPGSKEE